MTPKHVGKKMQVAEKFRNVRVEGAGEQHEGCGWSRRSTQTDDGSVYREI